MEIPMVLYIQITIEPFTDGVGITLYPTSAFILRYGGGDIISKC